MRSEPGKALEQRVKQAAGNGFDSMLDALRDGDVNLAGKRLQALCQIGKAGDRLTLCRAAKPYVSAARYEKLIRAAQAAAVFEGMAAHGTQAI